MSRSELSRRSFLALPPPHRSAVIAHPVNMAAQAVGVKAPTCRLTIKRQGLRPRWQQLAQLRGRP